jgi:cytoskeletal protein RodZ
MKAKKLALVVLVIAIVGVGIWWFIRPTTANLEKTVQALMPAKANTPPAAVVEMPKLPPVSLNAGENNPPTSSANLSPDPNDPQADLKTAIPDIVKSLRLGDILTLKKTYTPPNKLDPQQFQQMLDNVVQAMGRMAENPDFREKMQISYDEEAKHFESFETQTPTYNATGDEASYTYTRQPLFDGDETQVTQTFVKIHGKWYMKQLGEVNKSK